LSSLIPFCNIYDSSENLGSVPRRFALSPPYDHKEYYDFTQSPDAMFPILVEDRITKLSTKFKKRASSPYQETMESLAEEEIEENEAYYVLEQS